VAARNSHLDLVRGIAALAVAFGHARAFFFVDYPEVSAPGAITKVFYFVTGLGHQAVVVFFVLSGYFVGGAVANSVASRRWSWRQYGLNRMSRLWVVLVPALILTLLWDRVGISSGGGIGYDGRFTNLIHSGTPAIANDSFVTFFKNLFFLQTIAGPVYGSNGPLWSLANEFWYYLLFPLAYLAIAKTPLFERLGYVLLLGIGLVLLPLGLVLSGLIWLMGFFAFKVKKLALGSLMRNPLFFGLSLAAFLVSLCLVRRGVLPGGDYWLGLTFASTLPFMSSNEKGGWYKVVSERLSNVSYTLYLVHFPLLAFGFYVFRLPHLSQPTPENGMTYAVVCGVVLGYATLIWWFFERRTDDFKAWVEKFM